MPTPTSGQISIADIDAVVSPKPSGFSDDLNFLNGLLRADQRPASPNMAAFYNKSYFQNTKDGANCANGNCTSNCNCGNIQCNNCVISGAINCGNCDAQPWIQADCNCACTYNCTYSNTSYNCNCACNCSKIVCAKLYDMGLMNANIWAADQAYGHWLRQHDRRVYRGYIRWARIVTVWMNGSGPDFLYWIQDPQQRSQRQQQLMTQVAYRIGTPWSQHMAYLMGALPEDNLQGRILMRIGTTISRLVDRIPRRNKSKRKHGPATVYAIWACLYFSLYTSIALTKVIEFSRTQIKTKLVQKVSK